MSSDRVVDLRIDRRRLVARLDALAEVGAFAATDADHPDVAHHGVNRLALTDADREGRDLVVSWLHDLDLRVEVDAIGNVTGTWPADRTDPPVLMGSHIDTVRTGGRFDGNLGVLAGIEVLETVIAAGVATDHPLAASFFTNEEGSRFAPDMMGSLVRTGALALERALDAVDTDGLAVGDELARIGYVGPSPCPAPPPHAYVELHIEQGPVLEADGTTIGAVTGVQGISWTELTITGQSNHAGTTPIDMRHDAAYAAGRITTFVRDLAMAPHGPAVGTVGRLDLHPDLVNVVAARAVLTVDMRDGDDEVLRAAEEALAAVCRQLAEEEGVTVQRRTLARTRPVAFAPRVVDLVAEVAERLGYSVRRLPSGAGHDAQILAEVCPAGMVFVPSVGGISHNPAERTAAADMAAGADVLLHTVLALAEAGSAGHRSSPGAIPDGGPTGPSVDR